MLRTARNVAGDAAHFRATDVGDADRGEPCPYGRWVRCRGDPCGRPWIGDACGNAERRHNCIYYIYISPIYKVGLFLI